MSFKRNLAACVAALLIAAGAASAQNATMIERGKRATALLAVSVDGNVRRYATAFCVNPSGYFITQAEAIPNRQGSARGPDGRQIPNIYQLVIRPGETDQKVLVATLVRRDEGSIAILKVTSPQPFVALDPAQPSQLIETTPVTIFAFPYGRDLKVNGSEYPSVTVTRAKISALQKKGGVLERLQTDAPSDPSYAGAPVIDSHGWVLGLVAGGVVQARITFALPLTALVDQLSRPIVWLDNPYVDLVDAGRSRDFIIHTATIGAGTPWTMVKINDGRGAPSRGAATPARRGSAASTPNGVTLTLTADNKEKRAFDAQPTGNGDYKVTAIPVPGATGGGGVRFTATYAQGSVSGTVKDSEFRLSKRTFRFSEIHEIDIPGLFSIVRVDDNQDATGKLDGLGIVDADLGGFTASIDLSKATTVIFSPSPDSYHSLAYDISLVENGDQKARWMDTVTIGKNAAPAPAVAAASLRARPAAKEEPAPFVPTPPDALGAPQSLDLPGPITQSISAASGHLWILWTQNARKLTVFDAVQKKIRATLPLPSDDVLIAATSSKLIVIVRDAKVMQRWDLTTLTKEATAPLTETRRITGAAAGQAGAGPLLLLMDGGIKFYDVATLKPINIIFDNSLLDKWNGSTDHPMMAFASADGQVFTASRYGISPSGLRRMVFHGTSCDAKYEHDGERSRVSLSDDGRVLFTKTGLYDTNLKPLSTSTLGKNACFATESPGFFLSIMPPPRRADIGISPIRLGLYSVIGARPLFMFPVLEELKFGAPQDGSIDGLFFDQRIFVAPELGVVATIDESRAKLIVRSFDLSKALGGMDDYLVVTSLPPRAAARGSDFTYAIKTLSRAGTVTYKLEDGPKGMTISPDGVVHWKVPGTGAEADVRLNILVTDKSGQQVYVSGQIELDTAKGPVRPAQ